MVTTRLVRWLVLCQLAVSKELIPDPCGESCNVSRPDAGDTALLQTAKASGEPISSKEFAEKMQCDAQENSFSINGGDWIFVLGGFASPGILWEDLLVSWEKGGPHKEYFGIDYTFMSQSYQFTDYLTISSYLGVTLFPMTLWASQVIKLILPLPVPTGCNDFWNEQGFSSLYITPPWSLGSLSSPGFDDAGWPRSMDPKDLIVDSLAFRIRVQPRLKVLPGESPDAPPTMEVRLQFFLELRPVFRIPGPKPTTTTTTMRPYDRRRRGQKPIPPRDVLRWCERYLPRACCIVRRVLVNPLWTCFRCCPRVPLCKDCLCQCPPGSHLLSNSSDSEGSPSISYQASGLPGVDLAAPGELSELEWFAESPKWPENLTIPAGFLFDTPDLRKLLSTAERQRVQDFKETVDEETVPPENVSVIDGDCPVPFAIGGKEGCSPLPCLNSAITSDTSLSCEGPWPPPSDLVALHKTICGPGRVQEAFALGKTTQRGGIFVRCKVGTLIGGACSKFLPYDDAEILAAFPEDLNMFRCLGTGEMSEKPVHETVARGWCLKLEGNEKVIMVRREGRDNASVKCPDGYQVVGGGCTFIEGAEFTLRESYPTSQNTWECVFDSTRSCGEGSPVCLRSEARALCMGVASAL